MQTEKKNVNCKCTNIVIKYLKAQNKNVDELLDGLEYSESFLTNPHNWISLKTWVTLTKKTKKILNDPDALYKCGLSSGSLESLGIFKNIVSMVASPGAILKKAAKYNTQFNDTNDWEVYGLTKSNCIIKIRFKDDVNPTEDVDGELFIDGILAGIPLIWNLPEGRIETTLIEYDLKELLDNKYSKYNLETENKQNKFYIDGQVYGQEVLLEKEIIDGKTIYLGKYCELDNGRIYGAEEVKGILITKELVLDNQNIVRKGQIYNAPYFIKKISWRENKSVIRSIINKGKRLIAGDKSNLEALEDELAIQRKQHFELEKTKDNLQIAYTESKRKSEIFQSYTQKSLVERVDNGQDPRMEKSKRLDTTILFSDIRDMTNISEIMDSDELVRFLNSYFDKMNAPIKKWNGEIDKLMGDCIMAFFYDELNPSKSVDSAVCAAIDIKRQLRIYNRERKKEYQKNGVTDQSVDYFKVSNGVGIAHGPCVMGNIGSTDKLDYTLIGDVVNLTSRLERLTRHYGVGIIIGENVKAQLDEGFDTRLLDNVLVKGKKKPIKIYEVFDFEPDEIKEKKYKHLEKFKEAFEHYQKGEFGAALRIYEEIRKEIGEHGYLEDICADPTLNFYIDRCENIIRQKDAGIFDLNQWKGIYEFKTK
ncbi:adenylate/guanylate cyclase domain-containing protein [bacterium]|nr:adenylate/guanylate cyclase domain-containing protein [bacterium]